MCFKIHANYSTEQIAEKDIPCYKVVRKLRKNYRSVYQEAIYKIDKTATTNVFGKAFAIIIEGRHSFSSMQTAKLCKYKREVIVKCIIPKGTPYYYNPDNHEYVSLAIKVIKEIKQGK